MEEDRGGVVVEATVAVVHHGVSQPADNLGEAQTGGDLAFEEVGETLEPELLTARPRSPRSDWNLTIRCCSSVTGSSRPARTDPPSPNGMAAEQLAGLAGVDLSGDRDRANRRTALAALMGYATGIGFGAVYGIVIGRSRRPGWMAGGVVAGLGAMAGTAVPSTASGLTDPRRWGLTGWLEDLVPHLAYGFATAGTYEALTAR
jgi:hypothetical protein